MSLNVPKRHVKTHKESNHKKQKETISKLFYTYCQP
nr:MAG TPA: hypothetical protein [Caudoviricetes sp.]